jgi:hypothetical protein
MVVVVAMAMASLTWHTKRIGPRLLLDVRKVVVAKYAVPLAPFILATRVFEHSRLNRGVGINALLYQLFLLRMHRDTLAQF